jgi:3-oxoacyl-[acyl-carrier protein] reductase
MTYTAVITGGNKGIGADLAQNLLSNGYQVICLARNAPKIEYENLTFYQVDLFDPDATKSVADTIAEAYNVTHVIHNAGIILPNLLENADHADITRLSQLHLGAPLILTQAFLPKMKSNQFGRILFNGSRAALGAPTRTAYGASKAGIIGMARTWALELAKYGITVNVVAPGPILTDNFWGIIDKDSPEQEALANRIPVGRIGEADDVTRAFAFFCDPKNSFVTGQTLYVCGGSSIGSLQI